MINKNKIKILIFIFFNTFSFIYCHLIENIPTNLSQPDGTYFSCLSSGNHYYVRLHDIDNFTIIQSETNGYYYYAKFENNKIVPSKYKANKKLPANSGIKPGIKINKSDYLNKINNKNGRNGRDAPTTGTINNINIFIRFADEQEFGTPRYIMDEPFNKQDGPSISHYFDEVSYSQLEVITHHFPLCDMSTNLSYQDEYSRSYYQPYNSQTNPDGYTDQNVTIREHTLLKNAIESIASELPPDLDVDGNDDGYVDNVTFLVSGSPDGWSDLLWPHRWSLYSFDVWLNGSIVDAYNLNLASGGYFTVGTLCHEFFHSLGAPDLYHYNDNDAPISVGGWDVMDASGETPQHMSAWMKYKYGNWIDCPLIEQLGIYPLLPLQNQETSCYRINSPNSNNEFFILEYRNKQGIYEINTPGTFTGMLIYRINENLNGNANGPPDEVYLYRPGGTSTDNGNLTQAVFSSETGRTEFNDSTDPSSFLYAGGPGGINIQDIGFPGDIIEFSYWNIFIQTTIENIINDNDGDGLLNPGETADIILSANILNAPNNAENVIGILSSESNWVHFNPSELNFDLLPLNGDKIELQTQIILDETNEIIPAEFILSLNANFNNDGINIDYSDTFEYEIDINLNQFGFPINSNEIRSSPLIIDINNDGANEIILGDYNGIIHIYKNDGTELINNYLPYNTGNQIWGSAAAADIDLDNNLDFVIPSKSKHLYIFDQYNLKVDYETNVYLIGTPAIGNLDDDNELEIVFSGYSSQNQLFVINHDGSDVSGFPFNLNEKVKGSVALADFNANGKDDIVLGTDDNNLYLIYDDGTIAPGFPFIAGNKFQFSPSIINFNGERIIFAGNNDNHLYAINSDGSLRFSISCNDKIINSPSFIIFDDNPYSLFSSKDNNIYIVDMYGDTLNGWPIILDGNIEGEILVADLNNDNIDEIIAVTEVGTIYILHIDGSYYQYFPFNNQNIFTGSPLIQDIDFDNDFEIITGSLNSLEIIDIKEYAINEYYWNKFRANNERTGYFKFIIDSECNVELGDINGDLNFNVLDIITLANCILEENCELIPNSCAGDINQDDEINILDIVTLANCVLYENCNNI